MKPAVVMRAHNDMPLIAQTLENLQKQRLDFDLVVLDNASTDGTREEAAKYTDHIVDIPRGEYIPGAVLNRGMQETQSEIVVFLNSDCTPLDDRWLENLIAPFEDSEDIAATFGRQLPRPDCKPIFAKDTEDTYGDGSRQKYWRHCFSMASSAVRRSYWEKRPFHTQIKYSEDIEWTWFWKQHGAEIQYAPGSSVFHSHNYTLKQVYRRQFGEGAADAQIYDWSPWEMSFLRFFAMPWARQVVSDFKYAVKSVSPSIALVSPLTRFVQLMGRRHGFKHGLENPIPDQAEWTEKDKAEEALVEHA